MCFWFYSHIWGHLAPLWDSQDFLASTYVKMSRVFPLWAFLLHHISGNPAQKREKKKTEKKKKATVSTCHTNLTVSSVDVVGKILLHWQVWWCIKEVTAPCRVVHGRWWETDAPCPLGLWSDCVAWDLKAEGNLKHAQSTNSFFSGLERLEALELSWMLIFFFPCAISDKNLVMVGLSWKINVTYWMPFIMSAVRNTACCQGTWMDYRDAKPEQFSNQHLGVKAFLKEMK